MSDIDEKLIVKLGKRISEQNEILRLSLIETRRYSKTEWCWASNRWRSVSDDHATTQRRGAGEDCARSNLSATPGGRAAPASALRHL